MKRITKDFLQNILSQENPNIQVVNFSVTNAVDKGENFMSIVYKVEVEVTTSKTNNTFKKYLLIKLQPNNPIRRELCNTEGAFNNEALVYNVVLPEFRKLAATRKCTNILGGFAAYMQESTTHNNSEFIVLEDLGILGFKMAEKREGFDFKHCELVMRVLAEFHACSLALKCQHPEAFFNLHKNLCESLLKPERETDFGPEIETMTEKALNVFRSRCSNPSAVERITKLKDGIFLKLCDIIDPKEPLSVITHGDCWTNNMLFSYDEDGNPLQVKLIDFQIARYGSLALDLNYFFSTSTTRQVRDKYLYDLLNIYYETLSKTLQILSPDYGELTLSTVIREFNRYRMFGLIMSLWFLPFLLAHGDKLPDMETMTVEDFTSDQGMKKFTEAISSEYEERIVDILNECMLSGVI